VTTAIAQFNWVKTTTDAAAQDAFISGTKNLLTAVGLVQTADTGQIALPVTTPITPTASTSGSYGYLVFRFPDALQATTPIFVKVDFRTDASGGQPMAQFTVSSTTNGAGVLGSPSMQTPISSQSTLYQTGLNNYACYIDGTFTCLLGANAVAAATTANNSVGAVMVDRARSSSGVAQAGGYLVEVNAPFYNQYSLSRSIYGPASPALQSWIPALIPSANATSSSDGANVNVFRHYMMVPGVKPSLGALTYFNAEFGAYAPVTVTVLGSSHTYLPVGRAFSQASIYTAISSTVALDHCVMLRWE
jgi:hypothetical protein